jgi:basic membrane protein A and related proteins
MRSGSSLVAVALALMGMSAPAAMAQATIRPAIVYDKGGKFDKSFNEGVFAGAEKFKAETKIEFRDFEPQNDAQIEQALRRFAREGHSPIIAVGFSQGTAVQKVAAEFPALQFTLIDMVVGPAQCAIGRVQGA